MASTAAPAVVPPRGNPAPSAAPASPSLSDLAPVLGLPAHSPFLAQLAAQGISTLAEVRVARGVSSLASPGDAANAKLIDYHADLARVSTNLAANAALIAAGYTSIQKIATAPSATFLAAATPVLGQVGASRVQVLSTSIFRALDQVIAAAQVDAANGRTNTLFSGNLHPIPGIGKDRPCQCCDCQAAQSPAAYLADLLSYVVQNLLQQGQPFDLQFLVDKFHQPFGDLPTDCEAVDQQVRQVRICVEVLRSYLGLNPYPRLSGPSAIHSPTAAQSAALATAQTSYVSAAYTALLLGIGTSYQELALARNAHNATRVALAQRLGLTIDPYGSSRPDQLDNLLLDPTATPPAANALSEAALERTFGLVDTTRNPLSDGLTLNDPSGLITRWNLTGVSWRENTDADGNIYVVLTSTGIAQQISLYKDAAQSQLVASGQVAIFDDAIPVYEENESGLSGSFWVSTPATNSSIMLAAVPLLTSWQLQTLRSDWQTEDHPADGYVAGVTVVHLKNLPGTVNWPQGFSYDPAAKVVILNRVMTLDDLSNLLGQFPAAPSGYAKAVKTLYVKSQRLPVIDPDVIGPDDFRVPVPNALPSVQPFDVWVYRRQWVDALLRGYASDPDNIANMFALMAFPLDYITLTPGAVKTTTTPWNPTTPPSSFDNLWQNLADGVDVPAITLQIEADLALTVDSFNRMMDIWHADQANAVNPRNPAVTGDTWGEFYSILAQAAKARFFAAWRGEEDALVPLLAPSVTLGGAALVALPTPVLFGSPVFWVSLAEPAVGDWPPVVPAGQPLIDPSLIPLTDLPDPTVGAVAINFWNQRAAQVANQTSALRQMRENSGLEAALEAALGTSPGGNPMPGILDSLAQLLLDPTQVQTATNTIQTTLFMSVDDFNTLMTIRAMAADPDPNAQPTAAQWLELYGILTSAATQRVLYPLWLQEEAAANTGVVYWTARKAALPLWRSSVDARTQWHAAFATRTAAPIIDPDLIGPSDLLNPQPGDSAFDIWNARNNLVQAWLAAFPRFNPPPNPPPNHPTSTDVNNALLAVGVDGSLLDSLAKQSAEGTDITARLAQIGMTNDAFTAVLGVHDLLNNSVPILAVEWTNFCSIVVQVAKQLQFAAWNQEEAGKGMVLGPDEFVPAESAPPASCGASVAVSCGTVAPTLPPQLPPWRATVDAWQAWEDTLNSRIEQQATIISAVENVADSAENATLTQLRDALILATNAPGSDLCTKADWLTTNLMIDAETGACQKTTRIEQAIETLQSVVNGTRDGLIGTSDLTIHDINFDEEWVWMGTYASWRSAILVFMYPENILDPTLRAWQTPAFQSLVANVQSNPALTPDQASTEAQTYASYFQDVCTMQLDANCNAVTQINPPPDTFSPTKPPSRSLWYLLGVGGLTNRGYWSAWDPQGQSGYQQTFWNFIPGLVGSVVTSVIGATEYDTTAGRRFLCVFAQVLASGVQALLLTRYDLVAQAWDAGNFSLAVPEQSTTFDAVLMPQTANTNPPTVRIKAASGSIYQGSLNADATDWAEGDLSPVIWSSWYRIPSPTTFASVHSVATVSRDSNHLDLFAVGSDGLIYQASWDGTQAPAGVNTENTQAAGWSGFSPIDSHFTVAAGTPVTVISPDGEHIDVFLVTPGGGLFTNRFSSATASWSGFHAIDLSRTFLYPGAISVVARPATSGTTREIDLFCLGSGGTLVHYWTVAYVWNPSNSSQTSNTPTYSSINFSLAPTAVTPTADDVDLFVQGYQGAKGHGFTGPMSQSILTTSYSDIINNPAGNNDFSPIGDSLPFKLWTSDPSSWMGATPVAALSRYAGHRDIFVVDNYGDLWTTSRDANANSGNWNSWSGVGNAPSKFSPLTSVAAVARIPNHMDLFIMGFDGNIYWNWSDDSVNSGAWSGWNAIGFAGWGAESMPNPPFLSGENQTVSAAARTSSHLDIFAVFSDGYVYSSWWDADPDANWPSQSSPGSFFPFVPNPTVSGPFDIPDYLSSADLQARKVAIEAAFQDNLAQANSVPPQLSNLEYLKEAYYFVPMFLGEQLQAQGHYTQALDWFRTVYNYAAPITQREIYYWFVIEATYQGIGKLPATWLDDPVNPHLIAVTRQYAYTRYTILTIVQCLLAYADAQFTYDTSESDSQARMLYMTALELLALDILNETKGPCEELSIVIQEPRPIWKGVRESLVRELASVNREPVLAALLPQIQKALSTEAPPAARYATARALVSQAKRQVPPSPTLAKVLANRDTFLTEAYSALLSGSVFDPIVSSVTEAAGRAFDNANTMTGVPTPQLSVPSWSPIKFPTITYNFCIPPDPLIDILRQHAELNLYKLRHCMNISGITRQVDPYSAPTDVSSGLPSIGSGGQLLIPGAVVIQPMPYSFSVLIQRAQQLVQTASQMEAQMLADLQQQDQATYSQLQAQQSLAVANATVQLQSLTVAQATDGVALAKLQQQQAQITTNYYQQMLGSDVAGLEQTAITSMKVETGLQAAASAVYAGASAQAYFSVSGLLTTGAGGNEALAASISSAAQVAATLGSINQAQASLEVQHDDWQYQYNLGVQAGLIATQQITNANDQFRIAGQQLNIAKLQATNSEDVLNFLTNKFTNAALYQWMSGVLQGVYSYFLQQATAVAQLAENQMAFERQQTPPGFIQSDYWQPPSAVNLNSGGSGTNTQGLTGAERLSEDIEKLSDYYFETDQRKLQLSKTISLALLYPMALQQLRETGVMNFATPMTLFDRDFPGHYLRLIQSVSVSVIALIPPSQGINATLSIAGPTYTVTGPQVFQKVVVSRTPQSIAITSPTNATGVLATDASPGLLPPFQNLGVDTQWQYRMPLAANPFDFSTLADVQLTINYTALDSPDYRAQVLRTLDNQFGADQTYSFVNDLADAWYDLNNPDQTATPMSVQFNTEQADFPPNLSDIRIAQVLLYFARADGATFEVSVSNFQFTEASSTSSVGGAATTVGGIISTRRGNAASWIPIIGKSPFGSWQLTLPNTAVVRSWFGQGLINDILFVITYSGQTPPYE